MFVNAFCAIHTSMAKVLTAGRKLSGGRKFSTKVATAVFEVLKMQKLCLFYQQCCHLLLVLTLDG